MQRIWIFLISFYFIIPLFCELFFPMMKKEISEKCVQFCFYFILGNSLENEILELNNFQEFYETSTKSEKEIEYEARRKKVYTEYNDALNRISKNIDDGDHKGTEELEHTLEVLKNIKSTIDPLLERYENLRMKLLKDLEEAINYALSKLPKI